MRFDRVTVFTTEAILAVTQGGWLAMVVGVNVFLAKVVSRFGLYLVNYRLQPEDMHLGVSGHDSSQIAKKQETKEVLRCLEPSRQRT